MKKTTTEIPVTSPPIELLLEKARATEPLRRDIEEYESVIRVLVEDKKYTSKLVKKWLEDHGAGSYGLSTVGGIMVVINKKIRDDRKVVLTC